MSQPDILRIGPHHFENNHDFLNHRGPNYIHYTRDEDFSIGLTPAQMANPMPYAAATDVWDGVDSKIEVFENLPPLHTGPVHYHILEGIERAKNALAANEPDAERAFFIADLSEVYKQFIRWNQCLPGIKPFYAVKCNPDPYVLRLLAALGAGFDCASHGEISQVLSLGTVAPSRLIFANPCKATSFIRHASKAGVDAMTFDNADELLKISHVYPEAKLILRILTDDSKSVCRLGLKFGASLHTVPRLLARARELNLNVVGVSFHVGSNCFDPSAFVHAVTLAREAFDIGKSIGYRFTLLDVGGGFEDQGFESTAAALRNAISKSFGELLEEGGVQVIAEPGRFFVSKAFNLAANVIARRVIVGSTEESPLDRVSSSEAADGENQPLVMYYINDGVYGAFNCILFDHQKVVPYVLTHCRTPADERAKGDDVTLASQVGTPLRDLQNCSVWGPTCDAIDCVCPIAQLPGTLEVGDWLGFRNMGAYTMCAASQFNGFERSSVGYTAGVGVFGKRVQEELVGLSAGRGRV